MGYYIQSEWGNTFKVDGKQERYEKSRGATLTSVPMDCIKPFNRVKVEWVRPLNIGPLFVIQIMFGQDKTLRSSKVLLIIFAYKIRFSTVDISFMDLKSFAPPQMYPPCILDE